MKKREEFESCVQESEAWLSEEENFFVAVTVPPPSTATKYSSGSAV